MSFPIYYPFDDMVFGPLAVKLTTFVFASLQVWKSRNLVMVLSGNQSVARLQIVGSSHFIYHLYRYRTFYIYLGHQISEIDCKYFRAKLHSSFIVSQLRLWFSRHINLQDQKGGNCLEGVFYQRLPEIWNSGNESFINLYAYNKNQKDTPASVALPLIPLDIIG